MSIEELAKRIDENAQHDNSPWMTWFDKNYCSKCESVVIPKEETLEKLGFELWHGDSTECSYCEVNSKCRYFPDMEESPNTKEIIEMWLKEEV
jgi:hypothetical protein